jgi:RNA polymerase sigma-70 factor (ECF subfamily)
VKLISFYKDEKHLITKAAQGSREAQHRLYQQYAPKMLGVCRRYIQDLQFAEDVMVQGFLKVFTHLGSFKHQGSFEGWIRKIMVRECIAYHHKKKKMVFSPDADTLEQTTPVHMETDLDVAHIQRMIDALPEGYRTVFVLYAVEGYKHIEIAELLGISESTSKSQLFKARRLLQDWMKEFQGQRAQRVNASGRK